MTPHPSARRTAVISAVTALLSATALVAVAPAQAMSTDDSYWIPASRQVVVRGHGYGHGHGMSQYGAQGAALKGLDYKQIVDFYYPGTSWSAVQGTVRVLIGADTTRDVVVSPAAGLSVRDLGTSTTYPLPEIAGVRRWRIDVGTGNTNVVSYLTGSWHRWRPAGKAALSGNGEFFADGPVTLWTPSGPRAYRGSLRAASPTRGSTNRDTVNVVSMDQYLYGVVPDEMPASWQPEAVKAQAVAARTYAAWSRDQHESRYYQICDTTSCQVYGGVAGEDARSNAAVRATARQILTYGGKAAFTQFGSSSGGWTSPGGFPYLTAQADPYDGFAGNPVHDWSTTLDAATLERAYPAIGTLRRIVVVSRDGRGESNGRVTGVVLDGTGGSVSLTGDRFRSITGLRTTWFTVDPTPIISRWNAIGGDTSVVGAVASGEYRVSHGAAQNFAKGRIYQSAATGARELHGPVLDGYQSAGGPGSRLGLPITPVQSRPPGSRAKFQNGVVYANPDTGTVPVIGLIAQRYRRAGGVGSDLGWPTRTNFATTGGERVNFEHGYITWSKATNRTHLQVTG